MFVDAEGGGGNADGQVEISGPPLKISGSGGTLVPSYVDSVNIDLDGNTDVVTDQCGYSEVYRNGTIGNWKVSCEGIIGGNELGTLQALAESDDTCTVSTPVLGSRGGEFVFEKCSIKHTDDLNSLELPYGVDADPAFQFKASLQSPQAAKDSGGGG
jgi:hypothetical protein